MLETGKLYYFKNFDFERQNAEKKNKFFIIIANTNNENVLGILVTSQDYHLPIEHRLGHNTCINIESNKIHCFQIDKDIPVTDTYFKFSSDSYIPITKNIFFKNAADIWQKYITTNFYEDKGFLNNDILLELTYCISKNKNELTKHQRKIIEDRIEVLIEIGSK